MAVEPQAPSSVLVTGASGFVGSAVANALRREGYRVRVLIRRSSPQTNIDPADELVFGDILDRASVAAAVTGMRYVVHAAADYRLWAPSSTELLRTNVEGTRIVMDEALRAGTERIVHTSSVATFDLRNGPADETRPLPVDDAIGAYKRSKIVAENLVAEMVTQPEPASRDRQSLDADRTARPAADADRPHRRGGCRRSNAGVRRHRIELGPCR